MGDLFNKLKELQHEDTVPMHMPGAKRNDRLLSMPDAVKMDITEIDGFDNLHHASGIIESCAKDAAELYGADEALLLVNGSSAGVMSAICGATHNGDRVIVARNVHCSVINAFYINQLEPIYVYPDMKDTSAGIYDEVKAEDIERAFDYNKEENISAVIITSPTYEGVVSDIARIAEIVHSHGAVLIVDEAHGAHFGFDEIFPENAVKQGADAVIMSIHKTLPSFTQTALLMLNHGRINSRRVRMYWNMFQSTSPSYLLMGSIDNCITLLKEKGDILFSEYRERLLKLRKEISELQNIKILETDDVSKIVLLVKNGSDFMEQLRKKYKIELEMASEKYVIAMTSIGDTDEYYERFINALRELDKSQVKGGYCKCKGNMYEDSIYSDMENIRKYIRPQAVMSVYRALNEDTEQIPLDKCIGHIAAEAVCVYPPGINIVNPGEMITEDIAGILKNAIDHGLEVIGISDSKDIRCVRI